MDWTILRASAASTRGRRSRACSPTSTSRSPPTRSTRKSTTRNSCCACSTRSTSEPARWWRTSLRPILPRLARDVIDVADPVLRHSPCLPGAELAAIGKECGPLHAAAIAARRAQVGTSARVPPARPSAASLLPRSSQWRQLIGEVEAPAPVEIGLGELFLAASSEERRVILANLDPADPIPPRPVPGESVARLEAAALARRPEEFADELG